MAAVTVRFRMLSGEEAFRLEASKADTIGDLRGKVAEKNARPRYRYTLLKDQALADDIKLDALEESDGGLDLILMDTPDILQVEGVAEGTRNGHLNGSYERMDDAELHGFPIWRQRDGTGTTTMYIYRCSADPVLNVGPGHDGGPPSAAMGPHARSGFVTDIPFDRLQEQWVGGLYLWLGPCPAFPDQPRGGSHIQVGTARRATGS